LKKEIGVPKKTEYFKNPYKAYQTYTEANIDQPKEFLDYAPRFSLEDGIKDYLPEIRKIYEREVNG
jgi:ADP-L-glycero-D-manno-heptose 6-epimerase